MDIRKAVSHLCCVLPCIRGTDERHNLACQVLSLAYFEAGHPLIDLYKALVFSIGSNGVINLNAERRCWLKKACCELIIAK